MLKEYEKAKIVSASSVTSSGNNNGTVQKMNTSHGELETFEMAEVAPIDTNFDDYANRYDSYDRDGASFLFQGKGIHITGLENYFGGCVRKYDADGGLVNTQLSSNNGFNEFIISENQFYMQSSLYFPDSYIQNVELKKDSYTVYINQKKPVTSEKLTFQGLASPDDATRDFTIDMDEIYSINARQEDVLITFRNGCQATYYYNGKCKMINTIVSPGYEGKGAYSSFYDMNRNRYDYYQKGNLGQLFRNQNFTISKGENCPNISRGYRCMSANGKVATSAIEFTNDIPGLFFRGNSVAIGTNMQISSTNKLDFSLEENGYHVFMKEKEDGTITTPDGFNLPCKEVEDIAVTADGTAIHLLGGGYLKYDKNGKVTDQKLPSFYSRLKKNASEFPDLYDYLKNSTFSWSDLLTPISSRSTPDSNRMTWNYFPINTSTSIWKQKGISITGLEPFYQSGYQIYNSASELDTTAIHLSDFDQYMVIRGNDFSIDGLLRLPTWDVEDVEFNQDSYQIQLKSNSNKRDYLIFSNYNLAFPISDISNLTVHLDSCDITLQDGRTLTLDSEGRMTSYAGDWDWETDSIYSNMNMYTGQFGGSQCDFSNHASELLEDEWVKNFLKETYPDASELDYCLFLERVSQTGCVYTGIANTIFQQFEGKEEEFKKIFGYDMYTVDENGLRDYNFEYLILEIYSRYWQGQNITEIYDSIQNEFPDLTVENYKSQMFQIEEYYKDIENQFGGGSSFQTRDEKHFVEDFLSSKTSDYQYTGKIIFQKNLQDNLTSQDFKQLQNDIRLALLQGKSVGVGAHEFDLYEVNPITGERGKKTGENIGGHAMSIVGLTNKGDIKVSTWGKEYIVDLKSCDAASVFVESIQKKDEIARPTNIWRNDMVEYAKTNSADFYM